MKIVVVGAGQVGQAVAKDLAQNHDIIVIDHDAERLDDLRYLADVLTYEGDGGDIDVLKEIKAEDADIIIASTDNDHINILVCGIARLLSPEVFTIARVADTGFLKAWRTTKKAFHVDLMVGSNFLTATSIVQVVFEQMAQEVEFFDAGRIKMAEFNVPAGCQLAGKTVREADIFEGLRYAAVFHGGKMEVARGATKIPAGSRILVIGRPEAVREFGQTISKARTKRPTNVFILGGGELAFQTARLMELRGISPKVVEQDTKRAHYLAQNLPKSVVLNQDPTDSEFLKAEGISRAQIVVSALQPDERNLFASLQAKYLGAERVVSVVHEGKHQPLFEEFGVEVTFNPRKEVIEEIIRYTRGRRLEKVTFVEDHQGEVIEVELTKDSPLVARLLEEAILDFPDKMVIGAVSRNGEIIIPGGKTILKTGDDLVIFVDTSVVEDVVSKI